MDSFVRRFIRSSLVWLGVGVALGTWMAIDPGQALAYRPAHMHANLLGFVSMMIFGVAYHILPRFAGRPLRSRRAATVHLVMANAGLAAMTLGFAVRLGSYAAGTALLIGGSVLSAAGAFTFIVNVWATLEAPRPFTVPAAVAQRRAPGIAPQGG